MNNLETNCIELIVDTLSNRPKSIDGEIVKYNAEDKQMILNVIESQKANVENLSKVISEDCYKLLMELYDVLHNFIKNETL